MLRVVSDFISNFTASKPPGAIDWRADWRVAILIQILQQAFWMNVGVAVICFCALQCKESSQVISS